MWASPAAAASPRCSAFALTTLKDVKSLLADDAAAGDEPLTPCSPSLRVLHRSMTFRVKQPPPALPASHRGVVLYFTSLHVVRRTHEDCHAVRAVLRALAGGNLDERDVAMDPRFLAELRAVFPARRSVTLPQVFANGRWLGGVEEIRRMNESGELRAVVSAAVGGSGGGRKKIIAKIDGACRSWCG